MLAVPLQAKLDAQFELLGMLKDLQLPAQLEPPSSSDRATPAVPTFLMAGTGDRSGSAPDAAVGSAASRETDEVATGPVESLPIEKLVWRLQTT